MVIYSRRNNKASVVETVDLMGYSRAVFTTPLSLPNNSRINNVEHFYQTSKPTTRGDGSALVIGDIWKQFNTGESWFWNGTYWLSPRQTIALSSFTTISATNSYNIATSLFPVNKLGRGLLLKNVAFYFYAGTSSLNSINYWTISVTGIEWTSSSSGNSYTAYNFPSPTNYLANVPLRAFSVLAQNIDYSIVTEGAFIYEWKLVCTKTGTPPNIFRTGVSIDYHEISL